MGREPASENRSLSTRGNPNLEKEKPRRGTSRRGRKRGFVIDMIILYPSFDFKQYASSSLYVWRLR